MDENNCYRYPKLYISGQKNLDFNGLIFVRSLVKGIYVAIVIFFVLFGMVAFNVHPNGYDWDYQSYGLAASGALTVIVNLQVMHTRIPFPTFEVEILNCILFSRLPWTLLRGTLSCIYLCG